MSMVKHWRDESYTENKYDKLPNMKYSQGVDCTNQTDISL